MSINCRLLPHFNTVTPPRSFTFSCLRSSLFGRSHAATPREWVGGTILSVIQGTIVDHVGIHYAFILHMIWYLYILFYGLNGSK